MLKIETNTTATERLVGLLQELEEQGVNLSSPSFKKSHPFVYARSFELVGSYREAVFLAGIDYSLHSRGYLRQRDIPAADVRTFNLFESIHEEVMSRYIYFHTTGIRPLCGFM